MFFLLILMTAIHTIVMGKRIPPDKLCIACQEREIAPWSDYFGENIKEYVHESKYRKYLKPHSARSGTGV